jgi:acyl-coenzyme A synthetase/AMP-(fatty) acid ligase
VASDGSFVLNGRATEVANIGGVKVDPTLVDEAARSIEGIDDAALFTTEGPNGTEAILAVVCPDETLALAALAAARSAAFGMVIETVWRVSALPRTEHGKLRRSEVAVQWETERSEAGPGDRTL